MTTQDVVDANGEHFLGTENAERLESIQEKANLLNLQVGLSPVALTQQRLELLIDSVYGEGSVTRRKFDHAWRQHVSEMLDDVETELGKVGPLITSNGGNAS